MLAPDVCLMEYCSYKEPEGYSGLYKIRPDAPPASDSENDEDGAVPKSVSKKAKKAQPGAAKPPPPQRGPAVEKAQFSPGDSLFITIRDRPSAVPMAVSQWWQDYAFRRAFAVEQLANLVVEASGYRGMFPSVTCPAPPIANATHRFPTRTPAISRRADMPSQKECFKDEGAMDVDEQVGRLVDQLKDLPCEPHMRSADGKSVKLRKNLEEFWRKFVEMAPKENLVLPCPRTKALSLATFSPRPKLLARVPCTPSLRRLIPMCKVFLRRRALVLQAVSRLPCCTYVRCLLSHRLLRSRPLTRRPPGTGRNLRQSPLQVDLRHVHRAPQGGPPVCRTRRTCHDCRPCLRRRRYHPGHGQQEPAPGSRVVVEGGW